MRSPQRADHRAMTPARAREPTPGRTAWRSSSPRRRAAVLGLRNPALEGRHVRRLLPAREGDVHVADRL